MSTLYWSSTSSTDPTVAANWTKASDGSTTQAPTTGDTVYIQAVPGVSLANIAAADMSSVTLSNLVISQTYTGTIGGTGTTAPFGYWKIGATAWTIGSPAADGTTGSGAGRIKLDFGTAAYVGTILNTGTSIDTGYEPVRLKGTNSTSLLYVMNGRVGIATNLPGETAQLSEIQLIGGTCDLSSGVTVATVTVAGSGVLNSACAITTLTVSPGAQAITSGVVEVTTAYISGLATFSNRAASGSSIGTLNLSGSGSADFSQNPAAGVVGTANIFGGSYTVDPANPTHITITPTIQPGLSIVSFS